MLKICKVCGQYKEESEFPIHSAGRLRSTCKECWNKQNREKRNPEKERKRDKEERNIIKRTKQELLKELSNGLKIILRRGEK